MVMRVKVHLWVSGTRARWGCISAMVRTSLVGAMAKTNVRSCNEHACSVRFMARQREERKSTVVGHLCPRMLQLQFGRCYLECLVAARDEDPMSSVSTGRLNKGVLQDGWNSSSFDGSRHLFHAKSNGVGG